MGELVPRFEGDAVVVTGGGSGIGREVARTFGAAGASVVVADVHREPKDGDVPTDVLVEEAGGTATFVEGDVSEYDDVRRMVAEAREYGGVDVMVNNAGIFRGGPVVETSGDVLADLFDVNVLGVYNGMRAAAEEMRRRDDPGVIVNTASISSTSAMREQVHYDASKGAVRMLTRSGALELAEHDVRVNAVAPGLVATELTEGWSDVVERGVADDEFIKEVPLGRPGRPTDVAEAVLFLASENADYVTGELLFVDGGWQTF